jgi:hypothetical protein
MEFSLILGLLKVMRIATLRYTPPEVFMSGYDKVGISFRRSGCKNRAVEECLRWSEMPGRSGIKVKHLHSILKELFNCYAA